VALAAGRLTAGIKVTAGRVLNARAAILAHAVIPHTGFAGGPKIWRNSKIMDDGSDGGPQEGADDQGQSERISKRPRPGRGYLFGPAMIIGGSLRRDICGVHGRPGGFAIRASTAAFKAT